MDLAKQSESGLEPSYYQLLLTGGTGQTSKTPDQRITNVTTLPTGPFQLTNSTTMPYDTYAASPVHRFYQMWQQLNCSTSAASRDNPSGCNGNLFAWVEVTVGAGTNGATQPSNFSTEYAPGATTTGEGSTALGFYNVQKGDVPYFTSLADTVRDERQLPPVRQRRHRRQPHHARPRRRDLVQRRQRQSRQFRHRTSMLPVYAATHRMSGPGIVHEIENPNPAPGTNNWYTEDGYGDSFNAGYPPPYYGQPGIMAAAPTATARIPRSPASSRSWTISSRCRPIDPRCEPGHYYLLNNYNPGWFGNGKNAYIDHNPANTPFTIPPSSTPSIGDVLNAEEISWKYYGDQWNNYVDDPYQLNYGTPGPSADEYCNICNPFQYDTSIMSNTAQIAAHIQDSVNLYADIQSGMLPAVSIVKPSGYTDGHPASSKLDLFEGFTKKIVDLVQGITRTPRTPPSSSPSTKAAATTTPATCSRSTSSATARASR